MAIKTMAIKTLAINYFQLTRLFILSAVILSGCANLEEKPQTAPVIQRLSAEELAQIMPKPVSQISFEALIGLSKSGLTPMQVIEKLKESDTSYDLTPSQMVDLQKQGVAIAVLDYLHESRQKALQNNIADKVVEQQKVKDLEIQALKKQLQQQRQFQSLGDPFCRNGFPGFYPYGIGPRFRNGFGWYY